MWCAPKDNIGRGCSLHYIDYYELILRNDFNMTTVQDHSFISFVIWFLIIHGFYKYFSNALC